MNYFLFKTKKKPRTKLMVFGSEFEKKTYFFTGHVENPTKVYKGQKPIKLVKVKTPPNARRTIPSVPVTVPVK